MTFLLFIDGRAYDLRQPSHNITPRALFEARGMTNEAEYPKYKIYEKIWNPDGGHIFSEVYADGFVQSGYDNVDRRFIVLHGCSFVIKKLGDNPKDD